MDTIFNGLSGWGKVGLPGAYTTTTVEHFEALLPWNLEAEQLITYGVRILHKQ